MLALHVEADARHRPLGQPLDPAAGRVGDDDKRAAFLRSHEEIQDALLQRLDLLGDTGRKTAVITSNQSKAHRYITSNGRVRVDVRLLLCGAVEEQRLS